MAESLFQILLRLMHSGQNVIIIVGNKLEAYLKNGKNEMEMSPELLLMIRKQIHNTTKQSKKLKIRKP